MLRFFFWKLLPTALHTYVYYYSNTTTKTFLSSRVPLPPPAKFSLPGVCRHNDIPFQITQDVYNNNFLLHLFFFFFFFISRTHTYTISLLAIKHARTRHINPSLLLHPSHLHIREKDIGEREISNFSLPSFPNCWELHVNQLGEERDGGDRGWNLSMFKSFKKFSFFLVVCTK
jgi:hypothetical protein